MIYWYNGNLIQANTLELPIDDPGLLYGATVFTTLRVYHSSLDSGLTNWAGHCLRLLTTIQTFNWQPPQWNRLRQGAELLIPHFPVLRITLFPDGREWITGRSLPADLTQRQKNGIEALLVAEQRSLPAHKTGNYLSAWMAKTKAQQMGSGEAILVDSNGNWLETATGNLWGWLDGCWWTPPVDGRILPGVVRSQLINWLKSDNCPVIEKPWLPDIVKRFAAIAFTNSVVEVIPIHTVIEPPPIPHTHSIANINQLKYDPYHPSFQQLRNLFTDGVSA